MCLLSFIKIGMSHLSDLRYFMTIFFRTKVHVFLSRSYMLLLECKQLQQFQKFCFLILLNFNETKKLFIFVQTIKNSQTYTASISHDQLLFVFLFPTHFFLLFILRISISAQYIIYSELMYFNDKINLLNNLFLYLMLNCFSKLNRSTFLCGNMWTIIIFHI